MTFRDKKLSFCQLFCKKLRAVLKRSKNFRPSAVRRLTMPFAVRLPSDRWTDRPLKTSPDIAPVRRPTSDLVPIQWGQSYTMFTLQGKTLQGKTLQGNFSFYYGKNQDEPSPAFQPWPTSYNADDIPMCHLLTLLWMTGIIN